MGTSLCFTVAVLGLSIRAAAFKGAANSKRKGSVAWQATNPFADLSSIQGIAL
jgi:hypothetical protein